MTLPGVLALKVYADHNLHLIARSINYTVEAAVVFDDQVAVTEALDMIASTEAVAEAEVYTASTVNCSPIGGARKPACCRRSKCCWPTVCCNSRSRS